MIVIKVLEPIGLVDQKAILGLLDQFPAVQVDSANTRKMTEDQLIAFIQGSSILLLSNRPLSRKVIESCPTLKLISVAFTGLDHIDLEACRQRNIEVKNAAGYATHAVAELTICLALCLYRKILEAAANICTTSAFPLGLELFGKKVGIIGGGEIGKEVARLFAQFGCDVSIYQRKSLPLDDLLKQSDIVSLHIPLTSETRNFINKDKLALMKPNSILINTARGPIVDQSALISALNNKTIAGAALDVFDQEPPLPSDHPLLHAPNVLLIPHIGYRTREAAERKTHIAFQNIKDWLTR